MRPEYKADKLEIGTTLKITDYLSEDLILLTTQARCREKLFEELVAHLQKLEFLPDDNPVVELLRKRECHGSTGFKGGFAIPHAYTDCVDRNYLMVAVCPQGVDFELEDNERVHVIFLLLGSPRDQQNHVRLLARISRLLNCEGLVEQLLAAGSASAVSGILIDLENSLS